VDYLRYHLPSKQEDLNTIPRTSKKMEVRKEGRDRGREEERE
jgi:hypothetical protein